MGFFVFSILVIVASIVIFFAGKSFKMVPIVSKIVGGIGLVLGIIFIIASTIVIIGPNEVGVVIIFGNLDNKVLKQGINFVPPVADVYKYSTRKIEVIQAGGEIIEVRTNNGLTMGLDCSLIFYIIGDKAPQIYRELGTIENLQNKILMPNLRTHMRDVVSKYSPEEIYSTKRESISIEIEKRIREVGLKNGAIIDQFLIRMIKLPEEVDKAIQMKLKSQQESEAMMYVKQKAEQEAEIKIIEAKGLAEAQKIINSTLTPNYLQHEAIQAYKELANSNNTTFVIMPTNPNSTGMPLILNSK